MSRTQRLLIVLALNLALVAGLVVAGATAHSLAVLAAGGDYILDAAAVGVALIAIGLSARPASSRRPEGYPNASNVAALINAGWLLALELIVAGAAIDRLLKGTPRVAGLPVLVVSAVAALVMAAGAVVLHGDDTEGQPDDQNLSVAAVLLDTIADAAAAAGVAATGAIILATGGWYWLDPAVALVIAIVVAWHAFALIRRVISQLRSTSASGVT